jgi:hypothetical protein
MISFISTGSYYKTFKLSNKWGPAIDIYTRLPSTLKNDHVNHSPERRLNLKADHVATVLVDIRPTALYLKLQQWQTILLEYASPGGNTDGCSVRCLSDETWGPSTFWQEFSLPGGENLSYISSPPNNHNAKASPLSWCPWMLLHNQQVHLVLLPGPPFSLRFPVYSGGHDWQVLEMEGILSKKHIDEYKENYQTG